jgi:hypothetical protein
MPPVLLVAAAAGALVTAVLAVVRPAPLERLPSALTWAAVVAGAVAVGVADTAPTGWSGLDLVLRAAFGALVPLAAARAGTWVTVWLAIVASAVLLVADAPGAAVAVAGAATGALLALVAAGITPPPARAIAAAAAVAPLAHADWPLAAGASALATAVAALPVLLVGLYRTGRPLRGRITLALTVLVLVAAAASVGGLLAALSARSDVDRAVDLATDGIDLLGDDDERARTLLLDAAGAFGSAEDTLTTWWARPALLVPGVAQQSRAVATMASAGAELARTAAEASEDADIDSVRPVDGRIDLAALQALADPLDRSLASLRRAEARLDDVDSPALLWLLAERLHDLRGEVVAALDSAELASQVVDVAPDLLGDGGPRRYFIAFQNPSEQRGNGGFMGNWAELTASDGELSLTRNGRSRDLFSVAPPAASNPIVGEEEVLSVYGNRIANWTSINFSPDHPTVSRLISQLYPQSGGSEIDGVIAITPTALSGFLELTGPIDAPGYPEPISSENAARILLHEQYLAFPQERSEDREGFLSEVVETLFDRLTSGELPGPRTIAAELGPAVEARDLQLWSAREEEQALFARLGADGDARRESVDSFGIVTQNFGANKIDWFLHREVAHEIEWDPGTGAVAGTITATLRNDAPSVGLPSSIIGWGGDPGDGSRPVADGENFMMLTLYSTFEIEELTIDGAPTEFERVEELGHRAARLLLLVPSQSVREVRATVRGVVGPTTRYVVRPLVQPTARPQRSTSEVRVTGDWKIRTSPGGAVAGDGKAALTRDDAPVGWEMAVDVERSEASLDWLDRLRGRR